jgi:hypothetical protein
MATTTQEQITREAPEIEAYRLGLLDLAKKQAETPVNLPTLRAAELTPQQISALQMAGQGIGSYTPYMQSAGQAYSTAAQGYGGLPQYGLAAMQSVGEGAGLATNLALSGTQAYDPQSAAAFMNPYQSAVTQRAVEDMSRQANIQQQSLSAQAVKSGAFGGSREGVQRAELGRNLAEVQSKRIFEDYFANYSQAQNAAMNAFQNQQTRSQQAGNIALGAGQAMGQTGIAAGQLQGASAAGIGALGQQTAALGQLQSGLQQGDTSFLYNIGEKQQQQRQKELDALRQTELQQQYEPFQRISFLSDIYRGAPSSQQTISQTTAPNPSLVSQVAGLGTAGLAAYNLFGKPT